MKKRLLVGLSYLLVVVLAVTGTVAYLTDTDSDVNVMTLGNVKIAQHEFERVVDENGEYSIIDVAGTKSYELKEFTQGKPLYPFVGEVNNGYDSTEVRLGQLGHNSRGGMQVFPAKNVQDKFVVVENTGKSDAYVRTIVALEAGTVDYDAWWNVIKYSFHFTWEENVMPTLVEIDGNNYLVVELVYQGYEDVQHPNGVLTPGDYTYNNLAQVYMFDTATNEDVEAIDGNKNGTYDILVLSQAVQTKGFSDAETALTAGFGALTEENVKAWFAGEEFTIPAVASNVTELKDALAKGGNIILANDLTLDGEDLQLMDTSIGATAQSVFSVKGDAVLDLNGKTITVDTKGGTNVWTVFYAGKGANLTIQNGTVQYNSQGRSAGTAFVTNFGADSEITLKDVTAEQIGEGGVTQMIYAHGATKDLGKIYVEGGTYIQKKPTSATNPFYEQGGVNTNIIVSGGTYKVYHGVDLTKYMTLADGYTLVQGATDADGGVWYTVVAE